MKRIAVSIALMLYAIVGVAAERASTPEITAPSSGEDFMKLSSTEKLFWSIGFSQGYLEALNKIDVAAGPNTPCASLSARAERQSSTAGKMSSFELVSSLEKFYGDPANVLIPVGSAVRICLLQAGGKDPTTLQELIETARALGAETARRPQAK